MVSSQVCTQMFYGQMSEIRSCDYMTQRAMHVVKIKIAAKVRIQFYKFISQILLENDPPVSKKVF